MINSGKELKDITLKTVELVERAVTATLGPSGRTVLVEQPYGAPKMTKDGVTVAKAIELKDPVENAIASFFKTAASHTVDQAGDGTTTSIALAANIFKNALKAASMGANTVVIKQGIEKAVQTIIAALQELKVEIKNDYEKIKQVAIVSANGDQEIGTLITDAFKKIGNDGVINVEESKTREHDLKVVEGMQFDRGYISSYFATNTEKMTAELENPLVLIYDKKISSAQSIVPVLKMAHERGRSLLIIAEDIDGEAVSTMIVNKLRGVMQSVAVKAPAYGDRRKEICQDIAILTGGVVISEETGYKLENVTFEDLGSARKVVITANDTTIIEGAGTKDMMQDRIKQIRKNIEDATSDYDKEKLQERLAKLAGGVAILKVGGATEEAAKECKDRVDDAVQAVKAAIEEGIVAGGTSALLCAAEALDKMLEKMPMNDERIGVEAVNEAVKAPLQKILENAGRKDFAVILEKIKDAQKAGKKNYGLDVRNNQFGDMLELGVIDPVKVVRSALQNAAATAALMLITDVSITVIPKEEKEMPMGGGMGGMGPMGY